jgi:hypothetical protein
LNIIPFRVDVLKGLQEGGNALLKRLGGFFQSTGSYLPAIPANVAPSRVTTSYEQDGEALFATTFAKFLEAIQNADSMTFPVLDEYVVIFSIIFQ